MASLRSTDSLADQVALCSNAARLRIPCFAIVDVLQRSQRQPGEQVLATAITLIAMCESANLSFDDVIAKAVRMTADVEGPFTSHLQSVRDYARYELRRGGL